MKDKEFNATIWLIWDKINWSNGLYFIRKSKVKKILENVTKKYGKVKTMKKECKSCNEEKNVKDMLRYDTGEGVCFDCLERVMFKEIDDVKLIKTIKEVV